MTEQNMILENGLYKTTDDNDLRRWKKTTDGYQLVRGMCDDRMPNGVLNGSINIDYGNVKQDGKRFSSMTFVGDIVKETQKAFYCIGESFAVSAYSATEPKKTGIWIPKKAVEFEIDINGIKMGYKNKRWCNKLTAHLVK